MQYRLLFTCLLILLKSFVAADADRSNIPGRINSQDVFYTKIDNATIFFYMTEEKDALARSLVESINNNNFLLTMDVTSYPSPLNEVSLLITKYSDTTNFDLFGKIEYDSEGRPVYVDPIGSEVLNSYALQTKNIAEKKLGISLKGLSRNLSLNANHDALKYHHDLFIKQYEYLSEHPFPVPKYCLFQDLTLLDWHMAPGTCSATVVQDSASQDRFLMILFPKEVFGAAYTEPAVYEGPYVKPKYPGQISFPFHTAVAPIDFMSDKYSGSWKGKRISTTTRAVVLEEEIKSLSERSTYLPIDRPEVKVVSNKNLRKYPDGLIFRELGTEFNLKEEREYTFIKSHENVTLLEDRLKNYQFELDEFINLQRENRPLQKVYRVIKKESGFSWFNKIFKDLPADAVIVMVDQTSMPDHYKNYTFSKNCLLEGKPWIQLYSSEQRSIVMSSKESFLKMGLTPVEEILYRDEIYDSKDESSFKVSPKISLVVDFYIFSEESI